MNNNLFIRILSITTRFFYKYYLRLNIKERNFSIISNNCWAGHIYQDLNMEYLTPTVGLFIGPDDYLKFIFNLRYYISLDIVFLDYNSLEYLKLNKTSKKYPIGRIDNIFVHFLHYQNNEEAKYKWIKRCKRINWNNIMIKMDDQNGCELKHIKKFCELDCEQKIFFSSKKIEGYSNICYLPYYKNRKSVGDLYTHNWSYIFNFNLIKWINKN